MTPNERAETLNSQEAKKRAAWVSIQEKKIGEAKAWVHSWRSMEQKLQMWKREWGEGVVEREHTDPLVLKTEKWTGSATMEEDKAGRREEEVRASTVMG